jgi:hypothetical protein
MLIYRFTSGGRGIEYKASERLTHTEFMGAHTEILKRDFVAEPLLYTWFEYGDEIARMEITAAEFRAAAEALVRASQRQVVRRVVAVYAKNDEPFDREMEWQKVVLPTMDFQVFRDRTVALESLRKRVAEQHGFQIEL